MSNAGPGRSRRGQVVGVDPSLDQHRGFTKGSTGPTQNSARAGASFPPDSPPLRNLHMVVVSAGGSH